MAKPPRRRAWRLLVAAVLAPLAARAAPPEAPAEAGLELAVVTVNTWGIPFPFSPGHRRARLDRLGRLLDAVGADVVGFQELWGRARRVVPEGWRVLPDDDRRTGLGLMSRYPARVDAVVRYEPERRHDAYTRKGYLAATVDLAPAGPELRVFVTHLQAWGATERRAAEVDQLLAAVAAADGPALVLGDFNLSEEPADRATADRLAEAGLRDVAPEGEPTHISGHRFDRIFLRDGGGWCLEAEDVEVLDPHRFHLRRLSDHDAVRARLRLAPCGGAPRAGAGTTPAPGDQ